MRRPLISALCGATILFGLTLGVWGALYRGNDPRGLEYVLWKHGLFRMNIGKASGVMVGDAVRDQLVVGKTKGQIEHRFGPLESLAGTSSYNRLCAEHSAWNSAQLQFIRESHWMIVFDGNVATNLVLLKGC